MLRVKDSDGSAPGGGETLNWLEIKGNVQMQVMTWLGSPGETPRTLHSHAIFLAQM